MKLFKKLGMKISFHIGISIGILNLKNQRKKVILLEVLMHYVDVFN